MCARDPKTSTDNMNTLNKKKFFFIVLLCYETVGNYSRNDRNTQTTHKHTKDVIL